MSYPPIPEEIRRDLALYRVSAANAFQRGDWTDAIDAFERGYKFLLKKQREFGTRFHKGWELHNWGVALLELGRTGEAVYRILLAYVEDLLSAPDGSEDQVDEGMAGRVLRSLNVDASLLGSLKAAACKMKRVTPGVLDPEELLQHVLITQPKSGAKVAASIAEAIEATKPKPKRTIEGILSKYEERCFVGGNYFAASNLPDIIKVVAEEGFDPIVADDFDIPDSDVHHRCLLLLHLSSKAIFEVTHPAGQLMELERCRDYDLSPLILRQVMQDQDLITSKMISTMAGVEVTPYSLIGELRAIIHDYLHGSATSE